MLRRSIEMEIRKCIFLQNLIWYIVFVLQSTRKIIKENEIISNGSPCIEKTRKFVVETDGKDNIVRVVEISKNGTSVDISNSNSTTTAPAQSSSRDTSPFTKREQEYDKKYKTKEVEGEDTSSLPRRSASDGGSSSSSSNTKQRGGRSRSLSRAHSGRDSSLRSSFKSVSFVEEDKSKPSTVVDNNFDAVYKSLDTYHDVSEGHRRVTFLKDQEDIQARGSSLSKALLKIKHHQWLLPHCVNLVMVTNLWLPLIIRVKTSQLTLAAVSL